jgi:hypothetical protein
MKYALVNARKAMKDHIMLFFFFNTRGEDIGNPVDTAIISKLDTFRKSDKEKTR